MGVSLESVAWITLAWSPADPRLTNNDYKLISQNTPGGSPDCRLSRNLRIRTAERTDKKSFTCQGGGGVLCVMCDINESSLSGHSTTLY